MPRYIPYSSYVEELILFVLSEGGGRAKLLAYASNLAFNFAVSDSQKNVLQSRTNAVIGRSTRSTTKDVALVSWKPSLLVVSQARKRF